MQSRNDYAIMGYPVYLLVAIIVASVIIGLIAISVYNIWMDSQRHQVEYVTDSIISEAENMFEYADEGTVVSVSVEFPSSMRFVVFGSLPEQGTATPTDFTLDENVSNNYYYVMSDGSCATFHSNARFSGEQTNETAVFYPGSYDLTLELVKVEGRSYVKIYSK
jgi:hypothetical protein